MDLKIKHSKFNLKAGDVTNEKDISRYLENLPCLTANMITIVNIDYSVTVTTRVIKNGE